MSDSPSQPLAHRAAAVTLALALAGTACRDQADDTSSRAAAPDGLVVETDRGHVRGTTHGKAEVFRGIPYAAAPVGELRFRPPQPHAAWDGVRDATEFGSQCPQVGLTGAVVGDEDCLTLNLWRPAAPASEPRPVLLFIHGGANAIGSGSHPYQDGRRLAQSRDVIVVTINYRLGLLGFLAHPELTAQSGTSGNWAYLDQIAALEWVARNIAAFDGDPERVTVFGQSAGALSVCVLLASPLAAGLFDAAIMQSGGCDVASLAQREREGMQLASASGCATKPDPIACLRGLSAKRLVELAPAVSGDISTWALPIGGAVDGYVLPTSPWDLFAAGKHNAVPTLVGSNARETALFTSAALDSCPAYERAIAATFGADAAPEVLAEYPCSDYANGRDAYVQATTDAVFNCQARRILRSLAAAPGKTSAPALFRYSYAYTRADPAVRELGPFHGSELQLLFGTMYRLGYALPERERSLSEVMQTSWAALASGGSPVHAGTPGWERYDVERDNAVIFDSTVRSTDAVVGSHCEFWDARPR